VARTRAYGDSARIVGEAQLRDAPDDPQLQALQGVALAFAGRKAEAIKEGEHAVSLLPAAQDAYLAPYIQHQMLRIYLLAGQPEKALDQLESLLKVPYFLTPGWLKIDPTLDPLRKNPRFQKLVAGTA
jgi:tetratricopeptide (TPR) repeat protein